MRGAISIIGIIVMYVLFQSHLVSFVLLPIALAVFFVALPYRIPAFVILTIISELFSSTTPGIMTLAISLPMLIHVFIRRIEPTLSWKFAAAVVCICALQYAVILTPSLVQFGHIGIPASSTLIYSILGTSAAAFVSSVIWHEYA